MMTTVRDPTTWTVFQHDGPNHLGLWCNVAPCASNSPNHLGFCVLQSRTMAALRMMTTCRTMAGLRTTTCRTTAGPIAMTTAVAGWNSLRILTSTEIKTPFLPVRSYPPTSHLSLVLYLVAFCKAHSKRDGTRGGGGVLIMASQRWPGGGAAPAAAVAQLGLPSAAKAWPRPGRALQRRKNSHLY